MLTLGSLFDGAGTFPFAAQQCGVKALTEWSKLLHIPRGTLSNRLNMLGWSVEKALGGGKV